MARKKTIRVGGAAGYWGESAMAAPQLLGAGVDYLVFDYLAEISMSIMARARAKDGNAGYAADFISAVLRPHLAEIAAKKVKIITNAGGVNPAACAAAARAIINDLGLDLQVGVVTGDDLMGAREKLACSAPNEMFTGAPFPEIDKIASINLYIGAGPIAKALSMGADIVITGRCVDSALTLGACINEFNWQGDDWDLLAAGALAGHLLECGPQATGGNFTDWRAAGNIANIGYPIGEIASDGAITITKPENTSGLVTVGTVSEQLVYEIGDPQAYLLPDVICDFADVTIEETGENSVRVTGAKGAPAPDTYKTSLTYADGYRAGMLLGFCGFNAAKKARAFAEAAFARTRKVFRAYNAVDFSETSIEIIGADSQTGGDIDAREAVLKIAAKHPDAMGAGLLLKEIAGLGLATPPGLMSFSGGRPKPSPVIRLFSYLTPKEGVDIRVNVQGAEETVRDAPGAPARNYKPTRPHPPGAPVFSGETQEVPLIKLAWARAGDKGDKANIGVIARNADYIPYIWAALDEKTVGALFAHFIDGDAAENVARFYMPGSNAINYLINNVLGGGGVASLRMDPQGKAYAQHLLAAPIRIPATLAKALS